MNSRKIAVVTGGSSGLGSALIDALKNDYFVVNISRSAATNADANIAADAAGKRHGVLIRRNV